MKILKIILIIVLMLILAFLSFMMYQGIFDSKVIIAILSLITVTIPLIIKEISKHYSNKQKESVDDTVSKNNILMSGENTFDVFMYGHSGSGKTTFIQRLFTFDTSPIESTPSFDYYQFDVPLKMKDNEKSTITVQLADYKGQDVTQLFEAAKKNSYIDTIIFIADVAPTHSEKKEKLSNEQIIKLYSDDFEKELNKRINVHRHKYLSEFLMQAVFTYAASDFLKSVRFVINKIDILEELKKRQIIDSQLDIEEYVLNQYSETIHHLKEFCSHNDIIDFKTILISAEKSKNTKEMFTDLLNRFSKKLKKTINNER